MNIQKKKSTRRRLELESLESMLLLSTVVAESVAHAARTTPVHVAPVPPVVTLSGTIHASGKITGATTGFASGSGNLGKVGTASFKIAVDLNNPPSKVTLSTRHGNLFLASTSPIVSATGSSSAQYSIAGGTGSYNHATGSGTLFASYSVLKGNKLAITLTFA